jgi:dCTP deaminase
VGTPEENADLICFIDGKSTRARTGLVIHLTAPTIHAGWSGKVTLEIVNLGPFHIIM